MSEIYNSKNSRLSISIAPPRKITEIKNYRNSATTSPNSRDQI